MQPPSGSTPPQGVDELFRRFLTPGDAPRVQELLDWLLQEPVRVRTLSASIKAEFVPAKPSNVASVSLGGLFSIPNFLASLSLFGPKYIITSPEVEKGNKPFDLSREALSLAEAIGVQKVVVPFDTYPEFENARKILNCLNEGAIVMNGFSQEVATFIARNAGCGLIVFVKPTGSSLRFTVV